MTKYAEIKFKCRCMTAEASVYVPERDSVEDVLDFMTRVQQAIGVEHRRRSPLCMSATMEYAKIPVDGDVIGAAAGGTA